MSRPTNCFYVFTLTALFCLNSFNINSQTAKPSKQEKKEARKAELNSNFQKIDSLIRMRYFVIEASYLGDHRGNRISVSPTLNFISIDRDKATIQVGSDSNFGYNGAGGVTAEGRLDGMRIARDPKKHTFSIRFNVLTSIGAYDVFLSINSDYSAGAEVSGYTSGNLLYTGRFVPLNKSKIFKGSNTY